MTYFFRTIPNDAFGAKPIVCIRDIPAVIHNYKLFKKKADATGAICGAVVKADVHGLKMLDVAPALYKEGVRYFFVEDLIEGIELRRILPFSDAKIYAMAGLLLGEERYFHTNDIVPCLNCLEQIHRWNLFCQTNGRRHAVIHLDSHMNRIGLLDDEVEKLSKNYASLTANIDVEFYMSHFFDIKGSDQGNCYKQLAVLNGYLKKLPPAKVSFSCTDATILLHNEHFNFDILRIGIGLVGGAPNAQQPVSPEAKHTIEIYAKISQIKMVKKGQTVGYGGAYTTKRDTKLALVHIGYKDGYIRSLSGLDKSSKFSYMYIDGYRLPVIGKISLGITTIDVTDVPTDVLAKYNYVEVVGPNVDLKELADMTGCYELLAALGRPNIKVADYTLDVFTQIFHNK